jgi:hypothetical protein
MEYGNNMKIDHRQSVLRILALCGWVTFCERTADHKKAYRGADLNVSVIERGHDEGQIRTDKECLSTRV